MIELHLATDPVSVLAFADSLEENGKTPLADWWRQIGLVIQGSNWLGSCLQHSLPDFFAALKEERAATLKRSNR